MNTNLYIVVNNGTTNIIGFRISKEKINKEVLINLDEFLTYYHQNYCLEEVMPTNVIIYDCESMNEVRNHLIDINTKAMIGSTRIAFRKRE